MKQLIVNADESGSWFTVTLLILAGIQLLCLGLVAEILSRGYYESQKRLSTLPLSSSGCVLSEKQHLRL
jgi:hypothetical protein